MKALCFEKTGDAQNVLSLKQFDKPVAVANQVVVKLLSSSINPADFFFIGGTYRFQPQFPQIAGLEGAGIIDSVGEGVDLVPGTLVSFLGKNTWAEYVAVSKDDIMVLPPDFPVEKASQFTLNPFTAWGLLERAGLNAGDWLLLTAGNSVVSKLLIQIARLRNINVIATVRHSQSAPTLMTYGAKVINVAHEDIIESVLQITGGKGVNVAMDAVGGKTGTDVLQCLQPGGKLIIYSRLAEEPVTFYNADVLYKNLTISGFGIRAYLDSKSAEEKNTIIQSLVEIIGNPEFKMEVAATYPLDDYKEAVKTAQEAQKEGKVLFSF